MVAFALPAAAMAVLGALLLVQISDVAPLGSYSVGEYNFSITTLNLVIAILILFFAAFELIPTLRNIELPKKLTVKQNLIVYGKLYSVSDIKRRIERVRIDIF